MTVISTEAPTFWSDTEENMEPVIVSRRQGGVAVSDLPACGCDDDTTAAVGGFSRSPCCASFVVFSSFCLSLWRPPRRLLTHDAVEAAVRLASSRQAVTATVA